MKLINRNPPKRGRPPAKKKGTYLNTQRERLANSKSAAQFYIIMSRGRWRHPKHKTPPGFIRPKKLSKLELMQAQNKIFENIWKTQLHECFECAGKLNTNNRLRKRNFFQLVKSKKLFDHLALDPNNFILVCDKCLQSYQDHDYRDLPQAFYMVTDRMKNFRNNHPSPHVIKYLGVLPIEKPVSNYVEK